MGGHVRIVTDGVSDLPREIVERLGIEVVPVHFTLNGESYRDDGTLSRRWFYETLRQSRSFPQTAAPSTEEFLRSYRALMEEGAEEIVGLFVASGVSGLSGIGRQAAAAFDGDVPIHIVETEQVSMGLGLMVIAAAEAAAAGATVPEIVKLVTDLCPRTYVLGILDSLEHLRWGGRVNWTQAKVVELLKIKPLIAFYQGEALLLGRVRTRRRALKRFIELVEQVQPLECLALIHTDVAESRLAEIRDLLAPYAPAGEIPLIEVGPVFGSHVGPGGLGVALIQAPNGGKLDIE